MAKKPMSRARKTGIVFTIIGVSIVGLSFLGWAGSNAVVGIRDHTYYQNRVKYPLALASTILIPRLALLTTRKAIS